MSGTLMDRFSLPNVKVYTAGSVALLSVALYYSLNATSDPSWRMNATMMRYEALVAAGKDRNAVPPIPNPEDSYGPRNFTELFMDVCTFMVQEPLCLWNVINMSYCTLILLGKLIQRVVFGELRVAESQRVKDKFWNYVFYKFIFVFGVVNVQFLDEVLLWGSWFTVIGFLHLTAQLTKDRYEYLYSSPNSILWTHVRLLGLVVCNMAASTALLVAAYAWILPNNKDNFAFMAAECALLLVAGLHMVARYALQLREVDVAGPVAYYTHLTFDAVSLVVELAHVVHMVIFSNMLVSMASLVLLMQLRHLLHELQARLRRHRLYTSLATHMSKTYPMASREEVEKHEDNCAICWEPMKEARKLPCSHLFHNSCLCQWMQQDASCPTCRRSLAGPQHAPRHAAHAAHPAHAAAHAPARHPNHFFHFDGSRYVSWLPSFSVEVSRVRELEPHAPHAPHAPAARPAPHAPHAPHAPRPPHALLDAYALAAQVQQMFPQYSLSVLAADLTLTRSADLTLENILEGRLQPNATDLPAEPTVTADRPATVEETPRPSPSRTTPPASSAIIAGTSSAADTDTSTRSRSDDDNSSSAEEVVEEAAEEVRFSCSAAERQRDLQRRKLLLLAAARRRYLQRAV